MKTLKTEIMTKRERQEHMLHCVCGLDQATLIAMTDEQINSLFNKHLKNN